MTETEDVLVVRSDFELITCAEADCTGCSWKHYRPSSEPVYYVQGERASKAAYEETMQRLQVQGA